MKTTSTCLYCDGQPVLADEPLEHSSACPLLTVPAEVDDAALVAQAREVATLFHHHATGPWWRALCRLVVMCERPVKADVERAEGGR